MRRGGIFPREMPHGVSVSAKDLKKNCCLVSRSGPPMAFEPVTRLGVEDLICIYCAGSAGNYLQNWGGIFLGAWFGNGLLFDFGRSVGPILWRPPVESSLFTLPLPVAERDVKSVDLWSSLLFRLLLCSPNRPGKFKSNLAHECAHDACRRVFLRKNWHFPAA